MAQQTYDLLMKDPLCADICNNLESKCARASWCAEMKGDLAGAVKWLERERTFAQWLDKNVTSYKDALLNIDARLEQLNAARGVEVYALQEGAGKSFSGSGAAANGHLVRLRCGRLPHRRVRQPDVRQLYGRLLRGLLDQLL